MTHCSDVFIVDFELVNAGWVDGPILPKIKRMQKKFHYFYGLKIGLLRYRELFCLHFVLFLLPGRIFEEPLQCSKDVHIQ